MNLEEIINKNSNYLYKTIKNLSYGNLQEEDIEEIISDSFFIFWKNRDKFDVSKKINLYLAGIARNLVREKLRKIHINDDISNYENIKYDTKDISFYYEQIERIGIIEKSLDKMKKEDKDIFMLYYYSSKSIKDISKELEFSEFKIKSRLFRIRKKLRNDLERGGYRYE